jgi:fructosamine-3-kinase
VNAATWARLGDALGSPVRQQRPLSGGDINEAFGLMLADGRRVFAKTNSRAPAGFFEAEARGLAWLAEPGALRVPAVLAVGGAEPDGASAFLALEWLEPAARANDFDERLGLGLAALHRAGAACFGLDRPNFIALLPQDNESAPTWAEFWRQRRILPLLERARSLGLSDAALERTLERLLPRLEQLLGPDEPPARLHGDLWGGNLHVDAHGEPALIDPAAYAGHREVDLAMMRLFGGFNERVFDAYAESHPLADGHRERVELYQLYPLLVHLCTFGRGYLGQVKRCLARYA